MMTSTRCLFLLVLVLYCGVSRVQAFSGGGHKFVGLVAWQEMSPQARQQVLALLTWHPLYAQDFAGKMSRSVAGGSATNREQWLFAQASIWPDMARDYPAYHHANWHYINLPLFLTDADARTMTPRLRENTQRVWQPWMRDEELNAVQVLDRVQKTFRSPSLSNADRALLLCWAMHIVGDLHQPLHCTTLYSTPALPRGDQGGNAISILTGRGGQMTRLHGLWDGLLGGGISHTEALRRVAYARTLPGAEAQARQSLEQMSPYEWAREGAGFAAQYVYPPELREQLARQTAGHLEPLAAGPGYLETAGQVAHYRGLVAGHRLAVFLEGVVRGGEG